MARIDFSSIQGYEAMSVEDKLKALEAYELPDTASELDRLRADNQKQKDLITKYTGEISSLKKAQTAGLTEAERKAKEQEDTLAELQAKYDELLKNSTVSGYVSKYIALGYDPELAKETAAALVDGDMEKVFLNGEKFKASLEKQIRAEVVKATPKPDSKGGIKPMTSKEEIMKIKDASERQAAIAEHLDLFE